MSDVVGNGETYTERFDKYKVRLLVHNSLKEVAFNGEPVVPRILTEGDGSSVTTDNSDNTFQVENLGNTNLRQIVNDIEVAPIDKLRVIYHVIGQLQAIDQAGIVLFDRAGRNIMVLSSESSGISTRQVDLEEFYSKKDKKFYNSGSFNGAKVKYYEEKGFNMWGETAAHLSYLVSDALKDNDPKTSKSFERKYTPLAWGEYDKHLRRGKKSSSNPLSTQDILSILKKDIEKTINRLDL